jgi:hypothetical protein
MKKLIYVFAFLAIIAGGVYYYSFVYSKTHHRNAQAESSVIISSDALTAEYQANEQSANAKFLNKAVEVTGSILSISKDQAGHTTILMGKPDAFSNVSITLASTEPTTHKAGDLITVKGVCTGSLSDVIINEGVIK